MMIRAALFLPCIAFAFAACSGSTAREATIQPTPVLARATSTTAAQSIATAAPTAAATARPAVITGVVEGPGHPDDIYAGSTYTDSFVADLETGLLYRLAGSGYPCWIDDDTLVDGLGRPFSLADGRTTRAYDPADNPCALPTDGQVPRAGGRVWSNPEALTSADGAWTLVRTPNGADVSQQPAHLEGPGGAIVDVPSATSHAWSPQGHTLAIGGGWCGHEPPLQIIYPDTPETAITATFGSRPLAYVWRPDGAGLAVAQRFGDITGIAFLSARNGTVTRLWPPGDTESFRGTIIPLAYNPSGTRILFYEYLHRHCS